MSYNEFIFALKMAGATFTNASDPGLVGSAQDLRTGCSCISVLSETCFVFDSQPGPENKPHRRNMEPAKRAVKLRIRSVRATLCGIESK